MNKEKAKKIIGEMEYGYNLVAEQFSATRRFFWRDLAFLEKYTKFNDRVLDFGCGNGRLLEIIGDKNIDYRGLDISEKLIIEARKKYEELQWQFHKISGSESLPFPDNFFNVAYSVAVFHHLPSLEERQRLAKELYRVVCPGGVVVITVWNLRQWRYAKYLWRERLKKMFFLSPLGFSDCLIPFSDNRQQTFWRFHHAFKKREIEKLFSEVGFEKEFSDIINKKSLVFVGRKGYNNKKLKNNF